MTRDKAIEIAAGNTSMTAQEFGDDRQWALAVIGRATALLAAMGEPKDAACDCPHNNGFRLLFGSTTIEICDDCGWHRDRVPTQNGCCAATEARVVAEIADYLDNGGYSGAGAMVRCGDWRTKVER